MATALHARSKPGNRATMSDGLRHDPIRSRPDTSDGIFSLGSQATTPLHVDADALEQGLPFARLGVLSKPAVFSISLTLTMWICPDPLCAMDPHVPEVQKIPDMPGSSAAGALRHCGLRRRLQLCCARRQPRRLATCPTLLHRRMCEPHFRHRLQEARAPRNRYCGNLAKSPAATRMSSAKPAPGSSAKPAPGSQAAWPRMGALPALGVRCPYLEVTRVRRPIGAPTPEADNLPAKAAARPGLAALGRFLVSLLRRLRTPGPRPGINPSTRARLMQ